MTQIGSPYLCLASSMNLHVQALSPANMGVQQEAMQELIADQPTASPLQL